MHSKVASASPTRVGVVALDSSQRGALCRAIGDMGGVECLYDTDTADDLRAAASNGLDVVLVGAFTPGTDLLGVLADVGRLLPQARAIVLAGYVDHYLIEHATRAGARAVLPVETDPNLLRSVLRDDAGAVVALCSTDRDERAVQIAELYGITRRELEVLHLLTDGLKPDAIGRRLGIAIDTTRDHLKQLRRKLSCTSTLELVVQASRTGLAPQLCRPLP